MTVIGITGPTGSGKTTALAALERRGFEVVDCDALYYRLLQTSAALRRDLEAAFGEPWRPAYSATRRSWSGSTKWSTPPCTRQWNRKFEIVREKGLPSTRSIW